MTPHFGRAREESGQLLLVAVWRCPECGRTTVKGSRCENARPKMNHTPSEALSRPQRIPATFWENSVSPSVHPPLLIQPFPPATDE